MKGFYAELEIPDGIIIMRPHPKSFLAFTSLIALSESILSWTCSKKLASIFLVILWHSFDFPSFGQVYPSNYNLLSQLLDIDKKIST